MKVEWDSRKAAANRAKHDVDFGDAVTVLHDELALTICDETNDEDRFVTLGREAAGRVLVVVYTWRNQRLRLISARKATRGERRQYESKR